MTARGGTRRLAAILAADVAGYSRLMAADEAGTLARFNALKSDVIEPKIAQYHGSVVGSAGDSLLVEFASVVDAVQCAVETQERLSERNGAEPEDRRIVFRMGVNLGDVIAEEATIHGDGVNVASRLEKMAEPGSVVIAQAVHQQVKGKLAYEYADLGEQHVKNIPDPVRAYRVSAPVRDAVSHSAAAPAVGADRPSIAVLPFANMSGDAEQDYFCDGITEDIITELSRFRELFVIARNSSFAFKGKAIKLDEIARALGVAYVVEGSVRKAANRVRVTAQLIEAATGSHLWADRYDRELADIFAIQDEITRTVVAALPARIEAARLKAARRKPTGSMDAYDCYLRAKELTNQYRACSVRDEIALYERAVELDPSFARAYAWLSFARLRHYWNTAEPSDLRAAAEASRRGVELDGEDGTCQCAHGLTSLYERKYDQAQRHFDVALALNPNDAYAHAQLAIHLIFTGRPEDAIDRLAHAMRFNPVHPTWYWEALGYAHLTARRYEDAVKAFRMIPEPAHYIHMDLAGCLAMLGRMDEADAERAKLLGVDPTWRTKHAMETGPWQSPADVDHMRSLYKAAGLPE